MASNHSAQFHPELETIEEFLERFKVQMSDQLTQAGDDGQKKAAVLVKSLPVDVVTNLQQRLKPVLLSKATYSDLEQKLTAQYEIRKSTVGAAVQFLNRKQQPSESIEQFAKVINDLAASCRYQDCCRDRLLRDAFISGLRTSSIISGLLQDCDNKTFNDIVERAKLLEQLTSDAQDMRIKPENYHANKVSEKSVKCPDNYKCLRCGSNGKHFARDCFAINMLCNYCKKRGHLMKVCKSLISRSHYVDGELQLPGRQSAGNLEDAASNQNAAFTMTSPAKRGYHQQHHHHRENNMLPASATLPYKYNDSQCQCTSENSFDSFLS